MCACEEEFARRFLPHQLSGAVELNTRRRLAVTLGFQRGICNSCRGIREEPHPKAETYGRSSKVQRYYWREIFFRTALRFAERAESQGFADHRVARSQNPDMYKAVEKEVVNEIKREHDIKPKYIYREESQSEVFEATGVEVVRLDAEYVGDQDRKAAVLHKGRVCSVEEFTTLHYRTQGYDVLATESRPFHAMFGTLMWLLIQDPEDPGVTMVEFGERGAHEAGNRLRMMRTALPYDFGTTGYARRRAASIDEHLSTLRPEKEDLLWLFDYWLEPSEGFRQYLWAHRPEDVRTARTIVSILPPDAMLRILRYLVSDYWGRYTGWPDLLVHTPGEFFFSEVKSSSDKLRNDQKRWIRGNHSELHLPFKVVKVHRIKTVDT